MGPLYLLVWRRMLGASASGLCGHSLDSLRLSLGHRATPAASCVGIVCMLRVHVAAHLWGCASPERVRIGPLLTHVLVYKP